MAESAYTGASAMDSAMEDLLPRPSGNFCELEEASEPLMLSASRDPMLPDLCWAINHPQFPKPNKCLVFEIDLSLENMKTLMAWEDEQEIPNFATDEELAEKGSYELPGGTPVFSRGKGSQNAWDDVCQGWLTPASAFPQTVKDNLRAAVDAAMGPKELITLTPPVRDEHGNWTGGLAMERGDDRCKPVKSGTRCYTIANSYQSPREMWSPMAQSKVNGSIDAGNLLRKNLILAAAPFGMIGLANGPPAVVKIIENHASMLNMPPLGIEGNFGYQTCQVNVAPAEPFGSTKSLGEAMGDFGLPHRDKKDSPARFTNMTMASRLPDNYILGKFYIPRLGIHFTLRNFDSVNFCGLNRHGGSPPMAPEGETVQNDAVRITLIQYPPGAMGDGLGHLAVAALPGGSGKETVLKMTAEMQNLDCESRRHRAFTNEANFAQDGQVVNDTRTHVTFMARMMLLLVIWITNQLPFVYGVRIDSDRFLGAFSFQVENGTRESVPVWENGPGFRDPTLVQTTNDGSNLISQESVRAHHKRMWRVHYNKYVQHIPFAVCSGMGYEINEEGTLLEDLEEAFEGVDALGNPIEKGGRPWKKPAVPESRDRGSAVSSYKSYLLITTAAERRAAKEARHLGAPDSQKGGSPNSGPRRSGRRKNTDEAEPKYDDDNMGAIWKSEQYTEIQDVFMSDNPRTEGLETSRIDPNSVAVGRNGNQSEADEFLEGIVAEIRFLARLKSGPIDKDYQAVLRAHETLSGYEETYLSEPHLELAFVGMINAPTAVETCVHISQAWVRIQSMYGQEAKAIIGLKLQRQSIMQTTYTFWTWLDGYCVELMRKTLQSSEAPDSWIGALTRHVLMLLETRGPPREIKSGDFGAAELNGTYAFRSRRTLDLVSPGDVIRTVVDIVATWLNFPIGGKSRSQAWFIQAMFRDCHPSTLYLDSVWYAFCHLESEVFGRLSGGIPSPAAYTSLSTALRDCALSDPRSEEHRMIMKIDGLITAYRKKRAAAEAASKPARITTGQQLVPSKTPAPPLLLTLANDATQIRLMNRFLAYLVELEPLIDGYVNIAQPTSLQTYVNQRLDFLLPFREYGPTRIRSRGPQAAFHPAHSGTLAGLFSGLIFRGVTFASPFGLQAATTFFASPADWDAECSKFPNAPDHFFCNPWAYSRRKSKRSEALVSDYWDALNTPGCPDWE
ncbi:hypothetical protein DFH09DRAFT_1111991 [Mycena vulgaris]|nr:hypothetical protein DFH09DRAFT_1111991 [Mycena vulgaris]